MASMLRTAAIIIFYYHRQTITLLWQRTTTTAARGRLNVERHFDSIHIEWADLVNFFSLLRFPFCSPHKSQKKKPKTRSDRPAIVNRYPLLWLWFIIPISLFPSFSREFRFCFWRISKWISRSRRSPQSPQKRMCVSRARSRDPIECL